MCGVARFDHIVVDVKQVAVGVLAHRPAGEVGGGVAPLHGEVVGDVAHRIGRRHAVGSGTGEVARATDGAHATECQVVDKGGHNLDRTIDVGNRTITEDVCTHLPDAAGQIGQPQTGAVVEHTGVKLLDTIVDCHSRNRPQLGGKRNLDIRVECAPGDFLHLIALLGCGIPHIARNGQYCRREGGSALKPVEGCRAVAVDRVVEITLVERAGDDGHQRHQQGK